METFIASIMLWPCNFAPIGWMFCDGQSLPINQYTALFALIGTTYGGDGVSHFNLPNLPAAGSPEAPLKYIICIEGIFPSRP